VWSSPHFGQKSTGKKKTKEDVLVYLVSVTSFEEGTEKKQD
jgi:hypothetical protein